MCFKKVGSLGSSADTLLNKISQESFKQQSTLSTYFGTCTYNYSGAVQAVKEFPIYIQHLAEDLEAELNLPLGYFNMLLVNKYQSGKGLGRHRDNEPEITPLSTIVSISLGAARVFSITKGYRTPFLDLELNHGDIVVMSGRSQIDYYHAVLPGEGIRYNLTFRHNENAPVRGSELVKPEKKTMCYHNGSWINAKDLVM